MNEVIAIIRPERWRTTQATLERLAPPPSTQHRVLGRGREMGLKFLSRRGAAKGPGVQYLPKRMVTWVVEDEQVPALIEAIIQANRSGALGDGKIFVVPIERSIPIGFAEAEAEPVNDAPIEIECCSPAPQVEFANAPGK